MDSYAVRSDDTPKPKVTSRTPPKPHAEPPDEKFWIKYSPHHELPISGLASLAWHLFAVVVIVAVAWVIAYRSSADMPIETIQLGPAGGGGNPEGIGMASGAGGPNNLVEAARENELPPDAHRPQDPLVDIKDLPIKPRDLLQEAVNDKEAEREISRITDRGTQSLQKLAKLDKRLRDSLMGPPGQGAGGGGSGGGKGDGIGKGTGDGEGDGKINARTKRKLRWTISFNTESGYDYLKQLQVLGAMLALRQPDGEIKVVKELLKRPVRLESEDLQKLNRIFWIDDKRESVEQLVRSLGLDYVPDQVIALFPYDFEQLLLKKELAFRNKKEDQILETRFQILMRGNGRYDVVVTDQRYY